MARRSSAARSTVPSEQGPSVKQIRCAIYTRKSTEEGLEQEFNSLDAQREACAAYIISQRHEGWVQMPDYYDDGGYSGGNMERPALKQLLAEIEAGRVDVIVVYKVDRLTRALSDFARIVDILDRSKASFVSVTQAFNTTTSMGRLTLNVLLSFAQFEREVTGERIRDKVAASKKKGMWMGGPVPLGYMVQDRKLIIIPEEAETVRLIFQRHRACGSLKTLADDLAGRGISTRLRTMKDGRTIGGQPFKSGALYWIIRNVIYAGLIPHKEALYTGEHQGIISRENWDASQTLLNTNALRPHTGQPSILRHMIVDGLGRPMTVAHGRKGTRRYRYYVSKMVEGIVEPSWRLPAGDLESLVRTTLTDMLTDPLRLQTELGQLDQDHQLADAGNTLAEQLKTPMTMRALLEDLQAAITLKQDEIEICMDGASLITKLGIVNTSLPIGHQVRLTVPVCLRRRGHELRLVFAAPDSRPVERDQRLIRLLASGRAAWQQLVTRKPSFDSYQRSHLVRLARLNFLAPDIIMAILAGRQPVELTSRSLLRLSCIPNDWTEQRRALGFG